MKSDGSVSPVSFLPHLAKLQPLPDLHGGVGPTIELRSGLTVLVGANATGKTNCLKALRDYLRTQLRSRSGKFLVYLAAGRGSALEHFRSNSSAPHLNSEPAAVGNRSWLTQWWQFEGAPGMLMRLKERPDLLLKVEARLQALHERRLRLEWSQSGLQVAFAPTKGGDPYFANTEASGVLQLVPLIAALYDSDISFLVIDEPEISLHPQLQAFLLQEIVRVAGDPVRDATKKVIVIATHSPSMLPLKRLGDLTNFVFFRDRSTVPTQIARDAGELKNRALGALVARLSDNHKLAFFAQHVLLVEGPSDEIVVAGVAQKLDHPVLAANAQIVPVTGKGQFPSAAKLFWPAPLIRGQS